MPIIENDSTPAASGGSDTVHVPLYRLAHSRTGDKGNISNISVIAYDSKHYCLLREQLTPEAVSAWFAQRKPKHVTRHEIETLGALNFPHAGYFHSRTDCDGRWLAGHCLAITLSFSPLAYMPSKQANNDSRTGDRP
jgi:hypothetical protein